MGIRFVARSVGRYTCGYNCAWVSNAAVSIPDPKDRFSLVPIYIARYTDLVIQSPLTAVAGWSKGNELVCPPGRWIGRLRPWRSSPRGVGWREGALPWVNTRSTVRCLDRRSSGISISRGDCNAHLLAGNENGPELTFVRARSPRRVFIFMAAVPNAISTTTCSSLCQLVVFVYSCTLKGFRLF